MAGPEQPATLRDVAHAAGVSVATVSRVLTGADPVKEKTAARVRAAMEALSYSPNRLAQGLRGLQTRNLGLVLPGFNNPFFFELIAQTVSMAKAAGYSVLVTGDADPEAEALKLVHGNLVDGLLFVASRTDAAGSTRLFDLDVPIVCFDRAPGQLQCPILRVDNEGGAAAVTAHLASLGARQIAHVAGPLELEVSRVRLDAYRRTLAEHGLAADPALVIEGDFTEESGADALDALLRAPQRPDAVFAANDLMAIGVLRQANERGLTVPGELLVAGFDGLQLGRFTVPALTTYAQPVATIARRSVARLLQLVQNREIASRREIEAVPGELIVRESTQPRRRTP